MKYDNGSGGGVVQLYVHRRFATAISARICKSQYNGLPHRPARGTNNHVSGTDEMFGNCDQLCYPWHCEYIHSRTRFIA